MATCVKVIQTELVHRLPELEIRSDKCDVGPPPSPPAGVGWCGAFLRLTPVMLGMRGRPAPSIGVGVGGRSLSSVVLSPHPVPHGCGCEWIHASWAFVPHPPSLLFV